MSGLNQADIAILQSYIDREQRLAYWNYLDAVTLRETGHHNAYAVLAAQVVQNNTFDGTIANRYAAAVAAEKGITMTPADWNTLGVELVRADLDARREYLDGKNGLPPDPAKALQIPVDKIYQTHLSASSNTRDADGNFKAALGIDYWTAWEPLRADLQAGNIAAAQATWDDMTEGSFAGHASSALTGVGSSLAWGLRVTNIYLEYSRIGSDTVTDPNFVRGYFYDGATDKWVRPLGDASYVGGANWAEAPASVAQQLDAERLFRIQLGGNGILDANDARAKQASSVGAILSQPAILSGALPFAYSNDHTAILGSGGTLSSIRADQNARGNTITDDDLRAFNGFTMAQDTRLQVGQQILVPTKVNGHLVVDYGAVRYSMNPVTGEYEYRTNDESGNSLLWQRNREAGGAYTDRFSQTAPSGNVLQDITTATDPGYGSSFVQPNATNYFSALTTTVSVPVSQLTNDATSAGPSALNNTLLSAPTYDIAADAAWLGDVNLAQGNQAIANYFLTDGVRPGNSNLGTHIDQSTGIGLNFPVGTNPYGYSLFGSSLNHYAAANYSLFPADPLVLDLDGDGVQLTSYGSAPVLFDADNDGGSLEQTGWVSAQDGIVVHDLNGNGRIDNVAETLSEYYNGTAGSNGVAGTRPHAHGFAALKSLDSNADNVFNSADAAWSSLRVWVDANHDGKTDAGELKTFADLSITGISLATTAQSGEVRDGNEVLARGSFVQAGITKEAIAANFLANPAGATLAQTGSGLTVSTEGTAGLTSFVSQNTVATVHETLSAAALSVRHVTGGAGHDTIIGDAQANWLAGSTGADRLSGGAGDDVLLIDAADTFIDGGEGLDVVQVVGSAGVMLDMAESQVEIAVGGDGADTFVGGGRSSVFVRGGAGDDLIIGGAANDALSGEDGNDVIDGGAGNDLIRGHRGKDRLIGGLGDDVLDGGLEDDTLQGGSGKDVLTGGRGDDSLDGGDGIDVAEYAGSYADYRITRIADADGSARFRVVDTRSGADGADTLTNVEKLSFSDISRVDLTLGSPLPVKDVLTLDATGQALGRSAAHLISKAQLLANDRDWDSSTSQLGITEVLDARGGTVSLTQSGDVLFTPDPAYTGVMSFKYRIKDDTGHVTEISNSATGQSEVMKGAVYLQTADLKDAQGRVDPLLLEQWYLSDIDVMPVWQDYTGQGVRIGQFEPGGAYSTGPEVFDYRHPDLQPNADRAWLNTLDAAGRSNVPETFSTHATMVAGVMVAARNGEGGVGVAYGATLAGHYIRGEGLEVEQLTAEIENALAQFKNYDVVNNSWGPTENFGLNVVPPGALDSDISAAISQGRNGLGTAIVMAGGNDRATGANTNYNALTANRAVIVAGSINAPGDLGSLQLGARPFSNPGASILVSAPGSNIDSTGRQLIADNGSTFGNDYDTSQGTSFAAPIVSGVIALMLEAHPGLGYRDIQTILAMSATKVDDPNGADWATNAGSHWNGGGMHVSHDYGFGKVDARAAARLAESWTEQNTAGNEYVARASSGVLNVSIPDGSGMVTRTFAMAAGVEVESAQVTLELDHQRWGDLIVKLVSPGGTESVLVNRPGKAPGSGASDLGDASSGTLSFSFNSTRLRGEQSAGNWTLQVIDAVTGHTGTLKNVRLDLYGSATDSNDVYVYTNEFAAFAGSTRGTLADSNGGRDTLNASAVTGNSILNLNSGSTSTLAGKALTLSGEFENAFGGDGSDTLTGNALNNVLLGGRGADTLLGGEGNDTLDGGRGNDVLTGGAGSDLFVIAKDAGAQDTIVDLGAGTAGSAAETIALIGFGGLDFAGLVRTQVGADTRLDLGEGQAVLLRNQQASLLSAAQCRFFDSQGALQAWQLAGQGGVAGAATEGDDLLQGTTGDDVIAGLGGNDTLSGNDGNDKLLGGSGQDALNGGAGDDVLVLDGDQGAVSYTTGAAGLGVRTGGAGADRFLVAPDGGGALSVGLSGANMTASNLIYDFDLAVDRIDLSQFAWITSFSQLTASKALTINSTFITRISAQAAGQPTVAIGLKGIDPAALTAAHFIFAGSADATPMPMPGASASTVAGAAPLALPAALVTAGAPLQVISGTAGADALTGDAGSNVLDGLAGADSMTGRTGDDTYMVDNLGDAIDELPGGGYDSVRSMVSYTLSADVEALALGGVADLNATGNAQRNRLVGNAGANRLDGRAEADEMMGGAGNDYYVVDNQLDTVLENADEGIDTIESSVSWTLGQNIEHLRLTGLGNINATGNELANVLTASAGDNMLSGGAGNDMLDGGAGADVMQGGLGDDAYYVDNPGDVVTELTGEGTDIVRASRSHTLASNVENLLLNSAGAIDGTGNALDNLLYAAAGNNVLNGLGGTDTALYVYAGSGVTVSLAATGAQATGGSGLDTLLDIENLTGSKHNDTLTGNELANVLNGGLGDDTLRGGGGNDTLNGGAGADVMMGGEGNDAYYVDHVADVVTELAGEGSDIVRASVTHTLAANVENLLLNSAGAIDGTGNALSNVLCAGAGDNVLDGLGGNDWVSYVYAGSAVTVSLASAGAQATGGSGTDTLRNIEYLFGSNYNDTLTGNSAANVLSGGLGNDVLIGGEGADLLAGGAGNDIYRFGRGSGQDTVIEDDTTSGNTDVLQFAPEISMDQLWFRQTGNHLEISIIGTTDRVTVNNWYSNSGSRIEQVQLSDGRILVERGVQQLVEAMAVFDVPPPGQATLPPSYRDSLAPLLAANWT